MKNAIIASLTIGLLYFNFGCNNIPSKKDYYIVSKDSVNIYFDCVKRHDSTCFSNKLPEPLPPPGLEWYSKLMILFDSTDRVYIYQTKNIFTYDSTKEYNTNIDYTKFPNYIGLQPYQLMTFTSDNFISFIKNNNDILKLDTIDRKYNRLIYIASNKDTIENKAYYDLMGIIKSKLPNQSHKRKVLFITRLTTEEENQVIYCKRRNLKYFPEKIKWSSDFINGNCRPFTKVYDSTEKQMFCKIISQELFAEDCTTIFPLL
jgi:hypothetical protein